MTTRRRSPRRFSQGARQKVRWIQVIAGFTMVAAVAQTFIDISPPRVSNLVATGGTIKRTIGQIAIETAGVAADHVDFDVGIAIVTLDAVTALAVPDPATEIDYNWYFWQHLDAHLPGNAAAAMNQGRVEWDIKTMRKLQPGYRLVLVMDKSSSTDILNVSVGMRNLWSIQS